MTPTEADRDQSPNYYFFLSYAHSAPPDPDPEDERGPVEEPDSDPVVEKFYEDLAGAVRARARPGSREPMGFFDQAIPAGSDIKAELSRALGAAQVFVPLYSPSYVTRSWPLREQEVFRRRLAWAG